MIRAKNGLLVVSSLCLMAALFVSCVSTEVATSQEAKLSGDWTLVSMTEQGSEVVIPAGCTPSLSINEMERKIYICFLLWDVMTIKKSVDRKMLSMSKKKMEGE